MKSQIWQAETALIGEHARQFRILSGDTALTYAEVLTFLSRDADFRRFFTDTLLLSDFQAYRWETPPITDTTRDRTFEFVLLRQDSLARRADSGSFDIHFMSDESVVTFANLGGDAMMVVPSPDGPDSRYAHLAEFLRNAPAEKMNDLWIAVADAMESRIGKRPVWLSTAGMGVPWLHLRLDDHPKYYGHAAYRER